MLCGRRTIVYENGIKQFLNFATIHASDPHSIRCPCIKCGNLKNQSLSEIENHLYIYGIDQSYCTWIWHGEAITRDVSPSVDAHDFDTSHINDVASTIEMVQVAHNYCMANPGILRNCSKIQRNRFIPGVQNL